MDQLKPGTSCVREGGVKVTILALEGDTALLQMEENDEIIQYCVARGIRYENGELYWVINGHYFPCLHYETPFQALAAAVEEMREVKKVCR